MYKYKYQFTDIFSLDSKHKSHYLVSNRTINLVATSPSLLSSPYWDEIWAVGTATGHCYDRQDAAAEQI